MEYFDFVSIWDPSGSASDWAAPEGAAGTEDPTPSDSRLPSPCQLLGEWTLGAEPHPGSSLFLAPEIPDGGRAVIPGDPVDPRGPEVGEGTGGCGSEHEGSVGSGSASPSVSEGSPPWVTAVLLPREPEEPEPESGPGDSPLASSLGDVEPGGSASPDEVVVDPAEVIFLQSDVWHQNRAFVPISTVPGSIGSAAEEEEDKESPHRPAVPMDCEPVEAGECTTTTLASYVVTMHKEVVVWNNEPTHPEAPFCFPFGGQLTSSELQRPSRSEEPVASGSQEAGTYATLVSEVTSPPDARDHLVSEILGDRPTQYASLKPRDSIQGWDSECARSDPFTADGEDWAAGGDPGLTLNSMDPVVGMTAGNGDGAASDDEEEDRESGGSRQEEAEEEEDRKEETGGILTENDLVEMDVELENRGDADIAVETANLKALLANGARPDQEVAKRLASRLYHLDGFKRTEVAPYLEKNNDFSRTVAEEYLQLFDFSEMSLDQALRTFLKAFVLTGETQERERVLNHFSGRFQQCNPDLFDDGDAVHTITCALMLLNTDLHGQNLGKSMSSQDFIVNLEGMNNGKDFPKDMLKSLYQSIKSKKLEWAVDEEELQKTIMPKCDDPLSVTRVTDRGSPFLEVPHDQKAATYKEGFLSRKVHADIDGKKTPWGKRSWKTFYAVLKGIVIYLMKDEYRPSKQVSEEAISIHHSLASRAEEYHKRPNVFRLKTADWRIFLFQAQSTDQMNSWITRINLVAAMFSSPPFPAAVGSKRKFSRPILPSVASKQSQEEQLESHDSMLQSILDDLDDHQMTFPDKKWKTKDFEEYKLKQEYFEYEKCRIETYVNLLKVKLNEATDDLDKLEVHLLDCMEGKTAQLKKSHSSPSLNLEQAPVVKVKRNVSERRTYRKIIPSRHRKLL